MEERSRRLPLLLGLTWALSFCLTVFSIELRAIHGRGVLWTLPILAAGCLAIVNWFHYKWQAEWLTISLVWNLIPMAAAGACDFLLGFALSHKPAALLLGLKWLIACVILALILSREHRRIREREEWVRKTDEAFANSACGKGPRQVGSIQGGR